MAIVRIRDLWKRFTIHHERPRTLKEMLIHGWGRAETFWALRGVDLEVQRGEALGLIGGNGSGKSTLLKLIAGILYADRGEVLVDGRVSALLELGAGFHPDFTGRENVFLSGVLLGLSRQEIAARYDSIVAFAEMERFIDTPVKHYSSGMFMRLAFAVAVHVDPDVLLIDEVLAVGDATFQRKCLEKIEEFKRAGTTLIFVSHDLTAVRRICDRLIWLNAGEMQAGGDLDNTLKAYETAMSAAPLAAAARPVARSGSREVEIIGVRWLDASGQERHAFPGDVPMVLEIAYHAHQPVANAVVGVGIWSERGTYCYGINTGMDGVAIPSLNGHGTIALRFDALPLLGGEFLLDAAIHDTFSHVYDSQSNCLPFRILSTAPGLGVCSLSHHWELAPGIGREFGATP